MKTKDDILLEQAYDQIKTLDHIEKGLRVLNDEDFEYIYDLVLLKPEGSNPVYPSREEATQAILKGFQTLKPKDQKFIYSLATAKDTTPHKDPQAEAEDLAYQVFHRGLKTW